MLLATKSIGGTIQLLPFLQFCVKAYIASMPGFQNFELNLCNFAFVKLANLSIV